jgi:hypothetical protein
MESGEICLISGRMDPPHRGHIRTIQLLGQRFKKVIVVVLEHKDQTYSITYRVQVLREILENSKGNYEVVSGPYHFGEISVDRLLDYEFDVYAAGNEKVLRHIEELIRLCPDAKDKRCIWTDRPYSVSATTERLGKTIEDMA